jgi:hypothetical protein
LNCVGVPGVAVAKGRLDLIWAAVELFDCVKQPPQAFLTIAGLLEFGA